MSLIIIIIIADVVNLMEIVRKLEEKKYSESKTHTNFLAIIFWIMTVFMSLMHFARHRAWSARVDEYIIGEHQPRSKECLTFFFDSFFYDAKILQKGIK
jgi:hypothetical protein